MSVPITSGGSEPAATATPPFVPQVVEVALGTSSEMLTLMTTEAGGYTRNGKAFASGTDGMAEADGSAHTLTLGSTA